MWASTQTRTDPLREAIRAREKRRGSRYYIAAWLSQADFEKSFRKFTTGNLRSISHGDRGYGPSRSAWMLLRKFHPGFGSTSRGIAQTKSLLLPLVVRHLPFACRALRPGEAGSADPREHSRGHIQPRSRLHRLARTRACPHGCRR